jgi:hypothetical protein
MNTATFKSSLTRLLALSFGALTLVAAAPQAEAGVVVRGPNARVVVAGPRVMGPRLVVAVQTPPILPAPVVVVRPPLRTYQEVYRMGYGEPHRVYVEGYYDQYGRYVPAYWTWVY